MLPDIVIVMTTYFQTSSEGIKRVKAAQDTLSSWNKYLKYDGVLNLHLADDGTDFKNLDIRMPYDEGTWKTVSFSQQQRRGVGASLNAGFVKAYNFEFVEITAAFMDDWSLTQDFDITPWVKLLVEREDVGVVRLGMPHPNINGTVEMFTEDWQGWGLRLDRKGFAFGHRPALYHKRMIDHYGWFEEGVSALECERLYNEKFCADPTGPDIVLALPHSWYHIDTISLSAMEPKQ